MIEVRNVSKSFGGIKALNSCSMKTRAGKITAVIGPNGSGKTTLFNVISRLVDFDDGEVFLDGKNLKRVRDCDAARDGISRTFQEVRLFRHLTVEEHLEIALTGKKLNPISALKKQEDFSSKISEVLSIVGLEKKVRTYVSDLSYGQRKLLDLALAVAKKHSVILLDEPVAGINPEMREKIKQILKKLRKKRKTIVLIEHDMNFVMDLADYVYVLDYGEVIAEGKPWEIRENKKVLEAYIGT